MKERLLLHTIILLFISTSSFAQYTKLFDFVDTASGRSPYYGNLYSDGNFLYGMTENGGVNDVGAVFKIQQDGSGFVKLQDFAGASNGSYPAGSLISDGTFLYGMTSDGGAFANGAIFKIKPDGSSFTIIFDFHSDTSGESPYGSLFSDGTFLYGMTSYGGLNGDGTIFKIKPDGSSYSKLFDFSPITNGSHPYGSFISDGTFLYAMTEYGGTNGLGIIFKIKPDGSGFTNLMNFDMTTNGNNPLGSLIIVGNFLYGMTKDGGANSNGTIFKINTDGSGYVTLFNFDDVLTGREPQGSLVSDGTYLYGLAELGGTQDEGVVFKIKPDGSGFEKLVDFASANGAEPDGSLIIDGSVLYGMTRLGGTNDDGVIFKYALATGIDEQLGIDNQISIYPNPAKDEFTVTLNREIKNGTIEVLNVLGLKVFEQKISSFSNHTLSIKNISSGIYFVKINDERQQSIKKIVVL